MICVFYGQQKYTSITAVAQRVVPTMLVAVFLEYDNQYIRFSIVKSSQSESRSQLSFEYRYAYLSLLIYFKCLLN